MTISPVGITVKIWLFTTRTEDSELCPIKGPHDWKNRSVEVLEEDTDRNSSACK